MFGEPPAANDCRDALLRLGLGLVDRCTGVTASAAAACPSFPSSAEAAAAAAEGIAHWEAQQRMLACRSQHMASAESLAVVVRRVDEGTLFDN